jgi:hypothetical protein
LVTEETKANETNDSFTIQRMTDKPIEKYDSLDDVEMEVPNEADPDDSRPTKYAKDDTKAKEHDFEIMDK